MGQFSWLDCITGDSIRIGADKPAYVLVPKAFGGGHIPAHSYDGFGVFGGNDIYELVLEWNKDYIPQYVDLMDAGKWKCSFDIATPDDLLDYYNDQPIDADLRDLGILLSCYDEDNARLKYPIKITYDKNAVYESCKPSKSDPTQGCGFPEPGNEFYGVAVKLPTGVTLDESAVTDLVMEVLGDEIIGTPDITIHDAVFRRIDDGFEDPYTPEAIEYYPDDEFYMHINCVLSNSDDDQYVMMQFYDVFEAAGYEVLDVYYEQTNY